MPKVIHKEYIPLAILILLTIISILALTPLHASAEDGSSNATDSASADIGVNVGLACTLSGSNTSHTITLNNGSYNNNITGTTLHTICNGSGNYNIYAIGYTNNTDGNNVLDGGASGTIPTGITLNGKVSNWAIKIANSTGNTATIKNGYGSFSIIPSTSTLVASYNATSNQTTDSTLQTTYGVSISPNQPAGTYTGQVKYTMGYSAYVPKYMQDYDVSTCKKEASSGNVTVVDRRDGSSYTARYINDACWMTQNLRITHTAGQNEGVILGADSDFSAESITITNGTGFYSYSVAQYHEPTPADLSNQGNKYTAGQVGVWYSFCAAAAKSGTGACEQSNYTGSESICPSGWHLPTYDTAPGASSSITGSVTTGGANNASVFRPIYGGYYYGGSLSSAAEFGYWWSSTAYGVSKTHQHALNYSTYNNGNLTAHNGYYKYTGLHVRCVRTS